MSISLNNFDLKQCRDEEEEEEEEDNLDGSSGDGSETTASPIKIKKNKDYQRGPFYGTDNCDRVSTQVELINFFLSLFNFDYNLLTIK